MWKKTKFRTNNLKGNDTFEGNCLEKDLEIALNEKRPIEKNASQSIFHTRKKDGVLAETDIRTDRFDLAQAAMTKLAQDAKAKQKNIEQSQAMNVPDNNKDKSAEL